MKSPADWILGLSLLAALVSMAWAVRIVYPRTSTPVKWQRECCITGLVLGLISWLSSIAMIMIAGMRSDALGPLIPALFLFGLITTPVALAMGIATKAKPGVFLAIAEAAQAMFWVTFWVSLPRAIL